MKIINKLMSFLVIFSLVMPVALIPTVAGAVGPTVIFSDGFESGFTGWTSTGTKWGVDSGESFEGSSKSKVEGNTQGSDILLKSISTSGYENLVLKYSYKVKKSIDTSDHVYIEWFDGSNWNTLVDMNTLGISDWISSSINLPVGANNNQNFQFRFRANLDSGNDMIYLDAVALNGDPVPQQVSIVVDVCPNLTENQSEVPSGYVKEGDNCNPIPPPLCTPNEPMVVYSTAGDEVDGGVSVVAWTHGAWATLPGATWIWHEAQVSNPTSDETDVFTKTINVTGNVTSASIDVASDNGYKIEVNDVVVVDNLAVEASYAPVVNHVITNLTAGSNTLKITVKNFALADSTYETNPAGLIYKLTVNSETCPEVPTTATVNVKKIVCDSESDLPNWGAGDSTMQEITSNTANRYLSIHPNCHLADWTFEYAPDGTSNPGDNVGVAGEAWTPFSGTVNIPASSLVWFREQANPDYIPFSGDTSSEGGWDAVSAEMYCSKDTLNYDNYDYIAPLEAGKTYNCLAFNVLKRAPEPTTTSVKMCKFDQKEKPLSGWTLMLKGEKVQDDLSVPSNTSAGVNSNSLVAGTSYVAESTGTWLNQGGANPVDTEYSTTDSWATQMDGYTGYQTDILELQINNSFDPNSNWGTYNSSHKYAQSFVPSTSGPSNFRIFDGTGTTQDEGWFGDNSGNLNVDIYKGFAGITGEDGCVTFKDVPYGTYTADEVMHDGWSNASGLGEVSVNSETRTINVINNDGTTPAPVCDPQVELIANGSFEKPILANPSWSIIKDINLDPSSILDWFVSWMNPQQSGTEGLEIQNHVAGDPEATLGDQFAELDGDHPVRIYQNIPTIPGKTYSLNFKYSPRPGRDALDNKIEVMAGGLLLSPVLSDDGTANSNTVWSSQNRTFVATSSLTTLEFADTGTDTSFGGYIDGVSLRCQIPVEEPVCEEGYHLDDSQCVIDEQDESPTDVCPNVEGVQTNTEQCSTGGDDEEEEVPPSQPGPQSNPTGGNGPVNFGFVTPGGGRVLGASVVNEDGLGGSCTPYLTTYMGMGKKNNADEVKKLQAFLNEYLGLSIPLTGFFGQTTKDAVKQFQLKEELEVLAPWIKAGLHKGSDGATGYVYKTTKRRINLIKCSTLDIPIPQLP